jgi:uncharacterized membrane protein (UPF0136 family)
LGSKGFLDQTKFSSSDIKNENTKRSVFDDQLKQAPKQYQRAKKTPVILITLTILVGLGVVFLSRNWIIGLRHIGINLALIGALMLLFAWGLNRAVSTKVVPQIKINNAVFQQDIRKLATDITQQIDKNYWMFGGVYAVLGAGSIAAAEVFKRRNQPALVRPSKGAPVNGSAKQPGKTKRSSGGRG